VIDLFGLHILLMMTLLFFINVLRLAHGWTTIDRQLDLNLPQGVVRGLAMVSKGAQNLNLVHVLFESKRKDDKESTLVNMLGKYTYFISAMVVLGFGVEVFIFTAVTYIDNFDLIRWEFSLAPILSVSSLGAEITFLFLIRRMVKSVQVSDAFYEEVLTKLNAFLKQAIVMVIIVIPLSFCVIFIDEVRRNTYIIWLIGYMLMALQSYGHLSKRDTGGLDDPRLRELLCEAKSKGASDKTTDLEISHSGVKTGSPTLEAEHRFKEEGLLEASGAGGVASTIIPEENEEIELTTRKQKKRRRSY